MRLPVLLLLASACQQSQPGEAAARASAIAVASATPAPTASATPSAPAKAWFEGAWHGAYQAQLFRVEVPAGGMKEWKLDDGKTASGEGKLSLEAAADGSVRGTATGALGEQVVAGHVDTERAALTLTPTETNGFHGVILATRSAESLQGTLNASSSDSLQARQGSVTLTRAVQ